MEVTYRMTWQDWLVGYKAGLTHMTLLYRFVWSSILLLVIAGLGLTSWSKGYPTTFPPTTFPPLPLLLDFGRFLGVMFVSSIFTNIVCWHLTRNRTVEIQDHHILSKTRFRWFGWSTVRWRDVTDIVETGKYLCFCQNVPAAVVVPKLAFADPKQARAFFDQAERYWRFETGRRDPLPPDVSGVWPPAPRARDSQELGGTPKG